MLGSVLASALDSILDGDEAGDSFGGLTADMLKLTEDEPATTTTESDLITPAMLMKSATTTVHGMPTASIWGAPPAAATVEEPPAAKTAGGGPLKPAAQQPPTLTMAELEAQLKKAAVDVPAPLGGPPGLAQPAPASASVPSQPASRPSRKSEERASAWQTNPATGVGGGAKDGDKAPAEAVAKPTPILAQLKQQQGEHALMQKKMAEAQRFDAEMKQLVQEIETSKAALVNHQRAIHTVRVQLSQLGPSPDAAKVGWGRQRR